MLSEGWDAKTVTHIMGLRAFTSQLLCEQVVGRGLRRTSYDVDEATGLFRPEYVNIFGVPFTFLPHEGSADAPPPPPATGKTRIEPVAERRAQYEMTWPNVIRIDHEYRPQLSLDTDKVKRLVLDAYQTPMIAELAPMIDGKPDFTKLKEIHLEELARRFRMQRIVFETASEVYDLMAPTWKGSREYLLAQLVRLVERYIDTGRVVVDPPLFNEDDKRRRIVITLNMTKIVQHIWEAIRFENALMLEPVFDTERPIRSTGDMLPWYSGKACEHTKHSHINMCVYDSRWEANESLELDRNQNVRAWVKNDHIGFEITYSFKGIIHKFRPDYLVRLTNGKTLILEVKGQDDQQNSRPNGNSYPNGSGRSMGMEVSVSGPQTFPGTPRTFWKFSSDRTARSFLATLISSSARGMELDVNSEGDVSSPKKHHLTLGTFARSCSVLKQGRSVRHETDGPDLHETRAN